MVFGENLVFGEKHFFGENMVGENIILVKTWFLVKT